MKILNTLLILLVLTTGTVTAQNDNPNYNASLAEELGADDYGMKSYVLAILKTGSNQTSDRELVQRSFAGHMENINRLVEEGLLIVAGPLFTNENGYRGIFIFDESIEEYFNHPIWVSLSIENLIM